MRIGIIDNYDKDLLEALKFIDLEFYYFLLDSEEKRRYYNIFLLPFNELESKYDELDIVLNLSDVKINLRKVINKINDLNFLERDKFFIYRDEKVYIDNIIYFPYVIDPSIIDVKNKFEMLIKNKNKKTVLILCDKISIEIVGAISFLVNDFDIYVYGILDFQTSNSKNIHFIKRKLDAADLVKLLSYIDIVLDFSKERFHKELLYAALLDKPILTIKNFRNFPKLVINENIKKLVFSFLRKKLKYEISENLLENSKKIIENELKRLEELIITKQINI